MEGVLRSCYSGVFVLFTSAALCQGPAALTVQGIAGSSAKLTASDLAAMPQQTIQTVDHGTPATFQGVQLKDLLAKVALPAGENFHSTVASYYLGVEAQDGYRAVFAWAELDPTFMDKAVYVVTRRDGKPLPAKDGPFQRMVRFS